jgi:hypothetical protein
MISAIFTPSWQLCIGAILKAVLISDMGHNDTSGGEIPQISIAETQEKHLLPIDQKFPGQNVPGTHTDGTK